MNGRGYQPQDDNGHAVVAVAVVVIIVVLVVPRLPLVGKLAVCLVLVLATSILMRQAMLWFHGMPAAVSNTLALTRFLGWILGTVLLLWPLRAVGHVVARFDLDARS